MTKRTYRKFSPEFKREAVRLAEQTDGPVTQVARELGIRVNQIYKWRRQIKEKKGAAFPGSDHRWPTALRRYHSFVRWHTHVEYRGLAITAEREQPRYPGLLRPPGLCGSYSLPFASLGPINSMPRISSSKWPAFLSANRKPIC